MALNPVQKILQNWPLPAVVAWLACWLVFRLATAQGADLALALGLASGLGVLLSLWGNSWWRRLFIAAGFPLSLVLSSPTLAQLPAWGWLIPLGLLLLVYPINAWRDAPLFPTPLHALDALPAQAPLPTGARILDAGCGLGHGLQALRRVYPQAQLHGLEWSWPLRAWCALRCPWARVRQGDIWQADWSAYDMVYLFQRPESMARAAEKARAELRPGAWLVSLEFEATMLAPTAQLLAGPQRPLWVYQVPLTPR
ncbi:class I SAM-dependent methyltransferase [Rhodoferax saidenbachensis]|uniref:Methyltransferase type 12 n=1 Tax=Rhodoferax saidenbachensis TaxID=1484693 RepID=A0A1P8K571_9BURK|nr:class I SAM-dependent methyltransferase [Rhodoferax saidenbachensis]APW41142.1 methyltransferase type 12 [Rhodoferax saidenbachensis]